MKSLRKLRFKVQERTIEVDVITSKDQQVRDNTVFALWESEPKSCDIMEWVYTEDQEYINLTLILALTGRIKLILKKPKVPKLI